MQLIEEGDPATDQAAFRRTLGQFATGVTVVTADVGGALVGMTSNSFSSVSLDPPLILFSIKRTSQSLRGFQEAKHFAVNILAADQIALSQNFAKSGSDKFQGVSWEPARSGAPLLHNAVAHFECARAGEHDGGDHLIVLGQVERYRRYDRSALLFTQGRYAIAADHPDLGTTAGAPQETAPVEEDDELLAWMLIRAYGAFTSGLEAARLREGLTLMQARLLRAVRSSPGATLDELVPKLLFGLNAGEGVLSELVEKGFVAVGPGGKLSLTDQGESTFQAVVRLARKFEEQEFADVPAEDLAATRRVLSTVIGRGQATRRAYPWM